MLSLRVKVDLGVMAIKGYSGFPKALALLEPHHQIVWCHIQDNHCGGRGLTTLQRSCRCMLHPRLHPLDYRTLVVAVLPLCRDILGVFYRHFSRMGNDLMGLSRQILERFFCINYSNFSQDVLILFPTSLVVCHVIRDCLSTTEFLFLFN